jgi:hypothetical protein
VGPPVSGREGGPTFGSHLHTPTYVSPWIHG